MKTYKLLVTSATAVGLTLLGMSGYVFADVTPASVDTELGIGESLEVEKTVTTPEIPLVVDICLLQDETGSFRDDIEHLQEGTTASDLYDAIIASTSDAQFAVAGFRDYPIDLYGNPVDHVYRLLSGMSSVKSDWLDGIALLNAGGGGDIPEAQYDAIVATVNGLEDMDNCGWRDSVAGIQRVLVVTTDAPFHLPDGTHINDHASTLAALDAENIIVIGLKAGDAGGELDALAVATGGSVQALSSDGTNIAAAILAGLEELTSDVWHEVSVCDAGLAVSLTPAVHYAVPGGTGVNFLETIEVADDLALEGTTLHCAVTFFANHYPEEGSVIGEEEIMIYVLDITPPEVMCVETVNPHGKIVPPAGGKGGVNEDGFYELIAKDNTDLSPEIWVSDIFGSGPFGPYISGDKVKITESPGAPATSKKIGSTVGKAGEITAHLILNGDAIVTATDASGNTASATCLVPPPPK